MGSDATDRQADEKIMKALNLLHQPGDAVELRILNTSKGTVSGYFDDRQALCKIAAQASGKVPAVYITLNPVRTDLLARSSNRVQTFCKATTSDADIIGRRWFPIDIDPVRPQGISSTDEEHDAALGVANDIKMLLKTLGFADPISADSGNGGHLLYKIDLPNDDESRDWTKRCLDALDYLFSNGRVSVDRSVHNPARIWKLYGTMACKGDSTPERPHRLAKILDAPAQITPVTRAQLEALAAMLPESPKPERKANGNHTPLDIETWMPGHGLSVKRQKQWQGGTAYELAECPFNSEHNNGEARIIQFAGGALSFGCFHNSCQGYDWHALRDRVEPGWREKRSSNGYGDADDEGFTTDFSQEAETAPRKSQADKLVELIEKLPITLFHDEYGDPYARIKVDGHFENLRIKGKSFKRWLSQQFWRMENKVPGGDALNSAGNVIEAKACFEGQEHKLHNRVAWHDGAIWYDLGNWTAVKITAEGWEIVDDPPILFRRYAHQKAQATPQQCDIKELNKIFGFVNITNSEHRLLYKASLVCSLIPDIPHPIDVAHGDQGAAKTTTARIKKELIDPSAVQTLTPPNTPTEFVQQCSHHWIVPLDNLTRLPEWLSDALCRVCTGEGFSKRELYTDDDDIIYSFRRCISITGINLIPTKPDLLDRALIFELDPILPESKKSEADLWRDFGKEKPKLLGALFTLLSKAMSEYASVKLTHKPRMADFALWGCAVAKAMGKNETDFMAAYSHNIKIQNEEALDASPVAKAIIALMDKRDLWEGAPADLLAELNIVADKLKLDVKDKRYPRDPRWLWRRIKEVRTNLQAVGIVAEQGGRDSKAKKITLKRMTATKEDVSCKGAKNDGTDGMSAQREQFQEVTSADINADSADTEKNDGIRNPPESLDNADSADSAIIFKTFKEDEKGQAQHPASCACARCHKEIIDPWDAPEVDT